MQMLCTDLHLRSAGGDHTPPVAFWYNTRYIKTEGKRIFSCPLPLCVFCWLTARIPEIFCSLLLWVRDRPGGLSFHTPRYPLFALSTCFFSPHCPLSFCFLRIFPATSLELLKIVQSRETLTGSCPSATALRCFFLFFFILLVKFPPT